MIRASRGEDAMTKPVVGINCDLRTGGPKGDRLFLYTNYFDAVIRAGGLPVLDEEHIGRRSGFAAGRDLFLFKLNGCIFFEAFPDQSLA